MDHLDQTDVERSVDDTVRKLDHDDLYELRARWRSNWGAPPRLRSVRLMRLLIAWRLQSDAYGGLDDDLKRRLRRSSAPRTANPPTGTRLTREYQGVLYEVEILDDGVAYAGRDYGSLSEVARLITGVRWNGPRFFGLRREIG